MPKTDTKEKIAKKKKPLKKPSSKKNNNSKFEEELILLKDKHIRLKAEFDNFRRRKSEEISSLLQFEGESVIKGFIPVFDDLERMVNSLDAKDESLRDGMTLVQNKITKLFESLNVETFGVRGDSMDSDIHDAMLTQVDEELENDEIIEVFEKGYTYRDKVIRHAKVIVNKK